MKKLLNMKVKKHMEDIIRKKNLVNKIGNVLNEKVENLRVNINKIQKNYKLEQVAQEDPNLYNS